MTTFLNRIFYDYKHRRERRANNLHVQPSHENENVKVLQEQETILCKIRAHVKRGTWTARFGTF